VNVLIVDDNEAAADLLKEILMLQDHTAHCAYTGRQALDAAASEEFDAALVDLKLPDFPGTEVARQLRASANAAPPLIVAVSGFASEESGAPPGLFDHHLQKPIDFDALDRILAQAART
jgi:CheY-like chemotaxis protein